MKIADGVTVGAVGFIPWFHQRPNPTALDSTRVSRKYAETAATTNASAISWQTHADVEGVASPDLVKSVQVCYKPKLVLTPRTIGGTFGNK
jgi:hypothetical protein